MAGLRKRRGAESAEPVQETQGEETTPAPKVKNRKETLASVVGESTIGAAIDTLKKNEAFTLPNNKGWVTLLLGVDTIGGLSAKTKNDEAKGSILQLINSDQIEIVETAELLQEEFMAIVPTPATLSRMGEFGLLTETATYAWGVLTPSADGSNLDVKAFGAVKDQETGKDIPNTVPSYAVASEVAGGRLSLAQAAPAAWEAAGGVAANAAPVEAQEALQEVEDASVEQEEAEVQEVAQEAPQEAPVVDPDDPESGIDYSDLDQEEPEEDRFNEDDPFEDEEPEVFAEEDLVEEPVEDAYSQYVEDHRDDVVTEEANRNTVARRFQNDELGLNIDLEDFETTFGTEAPVVSINIAEGATDWLGVQVAQLVHNSNASLAQLHRRHSEQLREAFVSTMGMHVENIEKEIAIDQPSSKYAALLTEARAEFDERKRNADSDVSAQRREINERFEADARAAGEQAAAHASAKHRAVNRPRVEREIAEVGLEVDRRNEQKFEHDKQEILRLRLREAKTRMDLGTTRVFGQLSELKAEQNEAEARALAEITAEIKEFIESHSKDDVARAQALAEELARTDAVSDLARKHQVELDALRAEHADRLRRAEADTVRVSEEASAALAARDVDWSHRLEKVNAERLGASEVVDKLTLQLQNLEPAIKASYEERIASLKEDRDSQRLELEQTNRFNKRTSRILVILIVLAVIAVGAVCLLLGYTWGGNAHSAASAAVTLVESGPPGLL